MTSTSGTDPRAAGPSGAAPLLIEDVTLRFGGHVALDAVTMEVTPGSIHGLVGPNGAGKTSLLNCLSGLYRPASGSITLGEIDVLALRQRDRVRHGIGRTFQHPTLVEELTVLENVLLAAERSHEGAGTYEQVGREPMAVATWALNLVGVAPPWHRTVHGLPYGERKRIDMARALAMRPTVLMLDEPLAGTHGSDRSSMLGCIGDLRGNGISIVLIEHDVGAVKRISDAMTVLSFGQVIASGAPDDVMARPAVRSAYLGGGLSPSADAVGEAPDLGT